MAEATRPTQSVCGDSPWALAEVRKIGVGRMPELLNCGRRARSNPAIAKDLGAPAAAGGYEPLRRNEPARNEPLRRNEPARNEPLRRNEPARNEPLRRNEPARNATIRRNDCARNEPFRDNERARKTGFALYFGFFGIFSQNSTWRMNHKI
jgi:hypothetical protein